MVYICASPTSSTTVLDVSVPGLLSSTVRCVCTSYIIFLSDNNSMFKEKSEMLLITIMFDDVLQCFCFRCFSGVPVWRLM